MMYDYYIQKELIIEYKNKNGLLCTITTNINIEKKYINPCIEKEREIHINREINDNTYKTIIYNNGAWITDLYRKQYKKQLIKTFREIHEIIKIYTKNTAHAYILS